MNDKDLIVIDTVKDGEVKRETVSKGLIRNIKEYTAGHHGETDGLQGAFCLVFMYRDEKRDKRNVVSKLVNESFDALNRRLGASMPTE